jgi:hypothetical protein
VSRTNRAYKRGKPHRDLRKFIIVAEGEREDAYFLYFKRVSQRVDVAIVERDGGKSAVNYLRERLADYDYNYGIEPEDYVWFVLDVDRWPRKDIDELYQYYQEQVNKEISISNPCFEVWLHYHIIETIPPELNTPRRLKANLPNLVIGGYNRDNFAKLIPTATINASNADPHPDHYYPDPGISKVYTLAEKLLSFLGNNWNI